MKKSLLAVFLLPLLGCANLGLGQSNSNSSCPQRPGSPLNQNSVEQVSLDSGTITKTGQVSNGSSKGYAFVVKPGDELSFSTSDDVCIWIYGPDGSLVDGSTLLQEGPHVLQVAARQGGTTYNIDMGFNGTASSGGSGSGNANNVSSNSGSSGSSSSGSSSGQTSTITQAQAETAIKKWLDAKSDIFGPPFSRNLVGQLTTGPLYEDITKPNGSIDWLRDNGSRYVYSDSSIEEVWSFDTSNPSRPSAKVSIYEDRVLIKRNGRRDPTQSGASTDNFTYYFEKEDGVWKIYDYRSE
ncbi:MAG: ARC6/PARC6 family protein [Cyanobacteria bacterium J06649_4]